MKTARSRSRWAEVTRDGLLAPPATHRRVHGVRELAPAQATSVKTGRLTNGPKASIRLSNPVHSPAAPIQF